MSPGSNPTPVLSLTGEQGLIRTQTAAEDRAADAQRDGQPDWSAAGRHGAGSEADGNKHATTGEHNPLDERKLSKVTDTSGGESATRTCLHV
ncbi:uncharacterized protein V6R79_024228 [Siganus canaliculatus]